MKTNKEKIKLLENIQKTIKFWDKKFDGGIQVQTIIELINIEITKLEIQNHDPQDQ